MYICNAKLTNLWETAVSLYCFFALPVNSRRSAMGRMPPPLRSGDPPPHGRELLPHHSPKIALLSGKWSGVQTKCSRHTIRVALYENAGKWCHVTRKRCRRYRIKCFIAYPKARLGNLNLFAPSHFGQPRLPCITGYPYQMPMGINNYRKNSLSSERTGCFS